MESPYAEYMLMKYLEQGRVSGECSRYVRYVRTLRGMYTYGDIGDMPMRTWYQVGGLVVQVE